MAAFPKRQVVARRLPRFFTGPAVLDGRFLPRRRGLSGFPRSRARVNPRGTTRDGDRSSRLTLRVLEALASARLSVLLALFFPRVAREIAGALQGAAPLGIFGDQRPRNGVPHRFGLCTVTASGDGSADLVPISGF